MAPASRGRSLARSGYLMGCLLLCVLSAAVLRLGVDSRAGSRRVSRRLRETDGPAPLRSNRDHSGTVADEPESAADIALQGRTGHQPAGYVPSDAVSSPENQLQQASSPRTASQYQSAQPRLLAEIVLQERSSDVLAGAASAREVSLLPADPAQSGADSIGAAPPQADAARMQPDSGRTSRRRGHRKKRSAPVVTLAAGAEADAWWTRLATDTADCGVRDAGKARLLGSAQRESGDACEAACRATAGCNAWFYCEENRGCVDWQTQRSIGRGFCILMTASARPQPEPQYGNVKQPFDFSSYQAGYLKGDLYLRPPHVLLATAVAGCDPRGTGLPSKTWQRADWLSLLSAASKRDFARLQGFRFLFTHVKDDRSKINVIEDVLNRTASFAGVDYVLWMEQNALVVNPAVVFPYKRYTGKDIVMYGELEEVLDGNAAFSNPGVMLINNTAAARSFFRIVRLLKEDHERMDEALLTLKRTDAYRRSGRTYRNAIAYLFASNPDKYLAGVYLESKLCIYCFYEGADLEAPTMFITHFTGAPHCNDFSLASDDPSVPPFNSNFVEHYRLGRCKLTQALARAESRSIVAEGKTEARSIALQATVTLPGRSNLQHGAAACRQSCQASEACNAWIFCWRPDGCDNGREFQPNVFPYQACELYNIPDNTPLDDADRGPAFSSFSSGFLPAKERRSSSGLQSRGRASRTPSMVIVTAIPADPCQFPTADLINKLSVANKQDYARLHGFELHVSSDIIDPNITAGNWNKEIMILKTLRETAPSEAEWIMWVDVDTLFVDMTVVPRFDQYDSADLIVWGDRAKLMEGDLNAGINCGVLLIRNTNWARDFFANVVQYAFMPKAELMSTMRPVLEKEVFPLLSGFYDTPFITWLLKTRPEYAAKVFFEDQLGINRHWLQMRWGAEEVPTLITHYAGCTFCAPPANKLNADVIQACSSEFFKAYAYSKCTLHAGYRSATAAGTLNKFIEQPQCIYDAVDLSDIEIRLGD